MAELVLPPTLRTLNGSTLQEYLNDLNRHGHDWVTITNIQSAFDQILKVAIRGNVAPEDMPKVLLIMSDMGLILLNAVLLTIKSCIRSSSLLVMKFLRSCTGTCLYG